MTPIKSVRLLGSSIFFGISCLGWGQTFLESGFTKFYFDAPSVNSPIRWADSCLILVKRNSEKLKVKATPNHSGTVEFGASVSACSIDAGPSAVTIRLGINDIPRPEIGTVLKGSKLDQIDAQLPNGETYLAIITKPENTKWSELGTVVPRLFIPVPVNVKLKPRPGKVSNLSSLFQILPDASPYPTKLLVLWLYEEWKSEATPLLGRYIPVSPPDSTLYALSSNDNDRQIGDAAITLSKGANPTSRLYLTMLGGIWGAKERFSPFFQACLDQKTKPDADLLRRLITDPSFTELTLPDALSLAKKANPILAGVILKFASVRPPISNDQLKELFALSNGLPNPDRRRIYGMMVSSLPVDLVADFPNGLIPPYKSNGTIPGEVAYRQKWAEYLGISGPVPP